MTTIWTDKNKPSGTAYTDVSATGKTQYDDPAITYDDPLMYYDGYNVFGWDDVAKPSGTFTTTPGYATGMLAPPTYATKVTANDQWIFIPKPT